LSASQQQARTLPSVEAQLQQRMEALSEAEQRHGSIEERIQSLEDKVQEKDAELQRVCSVWFCLTSHVYYNYEVHRMLNASE